IILSELYTTGFKRSFSDEEDLTTIADDDVVYAFQAPPLYTRGAFTPLSAECVLACCDRPLSKQLRTKSWVMDGSVHQTKPVTVPPKPFLPRVLSLQHWPRRARVPEQGLGCQGPPSYVQHGRVRRRRRQNSGVLFNIRVVGGSSAYSYISPQDSRPLQHPAVDRALHLGGPGGTPHVKLVIEWERKVKDCFTPKRNSWPRTMRGAAPTVGDRRNKLLTLISFPMVGMDMAPHVVKRSQSMKNLNIGPWPPAWKPPSGQSPNPALPQDCLYDLYAVCNHHGTYCRNSVDGQWYCYDDSSVDLVPEKEVCTREAYILFYQRRNAIPPWSASSSVWGSTSSSMSDHWLMRLTDGSMRASVASRSSTTCPSSIPDSPVSPVFLDSSPKQEKGLFESKPFVRGLEGCSTSMRSPSKAMDTLSRVLPLRWSFGSKGRRKPLSDAAPRQAELVEYLESGRRPRCTKESIASMMAGQPTTTKGDARHASHSTGGLNCIGRPTEGSPPESPGFQVAEGQRRMLDKASSLRRSVKSSQVKDEGSTGTATLGRSTLTRRKEASKQGSLKGPWEEAERRWGSGSGVQHSVSTPSLRQGTLSRINDQTGKSERPEAQRESQGSRGGVPRPRKGEEAKSHDGLFSFLKGNFLKKDKDPRRSKQGGTARDGDADAWRSGSSRLSLSNREAGGAVTANEGRRSNGPGGEVANGKARGTADIKRSQSSSNIPTKTEPAMRRTASLHRNGQPPDKLSSGTLQRTRHSTHSLGRKKTVPESSF
ncbi:hypothetical protein NHX12_018618, partial [Muraenolepis orangiensis]